MTNDPRIDAFIEKAPEFAKPILNHMRELVHTACPEVQETIKWGMPFFEYKGILGGMAAFKQHCAFNFMKAKLMKDAAIFGENNDGSMGALGKITSLKDLPKDSVFLGYVKEAMQLNEGNIKTEKKKPGTKKDLIYPEEMLKAIEGNKKASDVFQNMSYSNQKEYVDWIADAKTEATRSKRLATMLEWLEEGKSRNWKYEKK